MLRTVVLFCAVFALAKSQSTAVSQCTAHPGDLPINTYIEGCTTPPCRLHQLEYCVLNIILRAPRNIRSMRTLATAYLLGLISVPHDLQEHAVTCNFLTNTYCPLLAGEVVRYQLKMFIESSFPRGTQATIEFRVVDQDNAPVLCLRVPVRIEAPRSSPRQVVVLSDAEQH